MNRLLIVGTVALLCAVQAKASDETLVSESASDPAGDEAPASEPLEWAGMGVSLVPPVQTPGDNVRFSFNLLGGSRKNIQGFELGTLFNWVEETVTGAQLGIFNRAGALNGVQLGVVDWSGEMHGAQASVLNLADDVQGAQVSVLNVADNVQGAQVSVLNVADNVQGAQVSVLNVADEVYGAQVSLLNIADMPDHMDLSSGLQVGVLNIGSGMQVGVLNIANQASTQVGVVNVASDVSGESLGLVPFVLHGHHHAIAMGSLDFGAAGYQLGSEHVRTSLLGAVTVDDDEPCAGWGIALDLHFSMLNERLSLEVGTLSAEFYRSTEKSGDWKIRRYMQYHIRLGWVLMKHLELFAGPTLSTHDDSTKWSDDESDWFSKNLKVGGHLGLRF